jgi:hypothetical protein
LNQNNQQHGEVHIELTSLLAGAGLTLMSLIILPAIAQRAGMSTALTGALRAVLMKASTRV